MKDAAQTGSRRRAGALLFALVVHAGLLLLLHPFGAPPKRHEEREIILLLPRLVRPPPEPVVIDARGPPQKAAPVPPAAASGTTNPDAPYTLENLPPYARPPSDAALLAALTRALACRPDAFGRPSRLPSCRQLGEGWARRDGPDAIPGPSRAKNAPIWQAEVDRRDAPFALPGADGGLLGILRSALTDPGAYSDPTRYSNIAPKPAPWNGADQMARKRYRTPQTSLGGTDYENRVRRAGAAAMGID